MTQPFRLHLFQAFGVELEYMIVDSDTLDVRPIADELIKHEIGSYGSDVEKGIVTWSNELVTHVIELKSTQPENNFVSLGEEFAKNVKKMNSILKKWNACLLPGAAHPWMNPLSETRLWPHESNEVYEAYNRIFDCRGHGWSNLQSTHLNLPFYDDNEFARLHAAIRVVLALLPAICASSPILDGKPTGFLDTRLNYYKTNQEKIPSIAGQVVPEAVFSRRQYTTSIYDKIRDDIAPFNSDGVLDPIWVNSRGAIPRFDRGSIEIRVMDVQECPAADLAIQTVVIETIKALVNDEFASVETQMHAKTEMLADILDQTARRGQNAEIYSPGFPEIFGLPAPCSAGQLWAHIIQALWKNQVSALDPWRSCIDVIQKEGTLSDRILRFLKGDHSPENIRKVYRKLSSCLAHNTMLQN